MSFIQSIPHDTGPEGILQHFPDSGHLLMALTNTLMRESCQLTVAERELIASYTSALNGCQLCSEGHAAATEALGTPKALLDILLQDIEQADCSNKLKVIMHFVKKLTKTPSRIVQSDVDKIFNAGWDEKSFYYVVSICGLFNYFNRLVDGYGIKLAMGNRSHVGNYLAFNDYTLS